MANAKVYRYRYVGYIECWTVDPARLWQPGEAAEVDRPIRNPYFVEVKAPPQPKPAPAESVSESGAEV